jgi:hypothetical protein
MYSVNWRRCAFVFKYIFLKSRWVWSTNTACDVWFEVNVWNSSKSSTHFTKFGSQIFPAVDKPCNKLTKFCLKTWSRESRRKMRSPKSTFPEKKLIISFMNDGWFIESALVRMQRRVTQSVSGTKLFITKGLRMHCACSVRNQRASRHAVLVGMKSYIRTMSRDSEMYVHWPVCRVHQLATWSDAITAMQHSSFKRRHAPV